MFDLNSQGQTSRPSNIFWFIWNPRPRECRNRHLDRTCSMYTTRNKRGHVGVCLTLNFKVNRQGHVLYFGLFEIPDLDNVEINTKIRSVACIQPEKNEVTYVYVWPWFSRSKVMVMKFILAFLISLTSKMLESTPRSNLYHVYSQR